jgi:acetyl esterase/lipase
MLGWYWLAMKTYLVIFALLTAMTAASVRGGESGLPDSSAAAPPGAAAPTSAPQAGAPSSPSPNDADASLVPEPSKSCPGVSFSRNLQYGENDLNVLDVATSDSRQTSRHPVLLFVAGDSFAGESGTPGTMDPLEDQAMCFAARHGMVGVKVSYRLAPAYPWPAAARDVAAAASWVHQNIDLFGGSRDEIIAVGYSVGAFHVASFLAHPELQVGDSPVAAAALVSGIYHLGADATATEKAYFGADASKYNERSALPGLLKSETPLLVAWSAVDPPSLVAQGEKLKQLLCNSIAHCPHISVIKHRDTPSSVFGLDGSDGSLAEPILELVREIEARGQP